MNFIEVKTDEDLLKCIELRKKVFRNEENGPELLYIIDEYDKMQDTKNYLLEIDNVPVATIRFIKVDDITIKLQRMVVPMEFRKKGYAKQLLNYLEKDALNIGYKKIILDSAQRSVGFYDKCGYITVSEVFYEDERPHVKMEKTLI